jgi:pimeloyl-ACP methyl ester carboxylesterase
VRQQKAILSRRDWRASLPQIRCPTVVIVGDSDEITPPKLAEEIVSGITGARLVLVPDCGHLTTFERSAEVDAAPAAWMADKV